MCSLDEKSKTKIEKQNVQKEFRLQLFVLIYDKGPDLEAQMMIIQLVGTLKTQLLLHL